MGGETRCTASTISLNEEAPLLSHAEISSEGRQVGPEQGCVWDWEGYKLTVGIRKGRICVMSFSQIIPR